ncbi:MAG: adenosylcobinamide-GDP ribazoletransferase [Candidatus Omnitrophica bacterium]|nr:adenosylcobinamide-GDP ribazoletransferase [Candidatus Omnitrophota bacterium]
MIKSLLLALQFLTVIPLRIKNVDDRSVGRSLIYFPLAGLFLGLLLAGMYKLLLILNFPPLAISVILVVALIILTGGLHLDGLSDTSDAFLSRKGREQMLEIMRDSHAGVMGILAIISVLLLKIVFIYSIAESFTPMALVLMCVLSRWAMVLPIYLFPYARTEGKAKFFIQGVNLKILLLSTGLALACVLIFWQLKGLYIFVIVAAFTYLAGRFINKKLSGVTGDTLGALCELNEPVVLLTVFILTRLTF